MPRSLSPSNTSRRRGGCNDDSVERHARRENYKTKKSCHPTEKSVALLEYLIRTYTNEGDLVLDNTMGSGSTCVAAVNTKRDYIGIEMDENYYNIAVKRVNDAKSELRLF